MIDFTKSVEARQRQSSVSIEDTDYAIHTSFHYWVLFGRMILKNHTYGDYDQFYKFTVPENREAGLNALTAFFRNEQPLPHDLGEKTDIIGVDWKIDSEYIRAAFLEKYHIDLLISDLHWHDFLALFHALKDTAINDIMSARFYTDKKSKKDLMKKLRAMWELVKKTNKITPKKREE